MRIYADETLRQWQDTVHAFIENEVGIDYCRECYQNRKYPHELYNKAVNNDWVGLTVPERYGGQNGDQVEQMVLFEALGKYGYDFGIPFVTSATVVENLIKFGTNEQIERFVPSLLDGDLRFTVGVTEPNTGSDAASLATRAEQDGETYVINGEKTYQSGAQAPNTVVQTYVRTDPEAPKRDGISTILIPTHLDGVEVSELSLVARKAVGTAQVYFDDVRVPADNRIGAANDGWEILSDHLIREHLGMAALMIGNAQTVVDTATDEAASRERFGQPIGQFQAISHRLADMQTEVDAARLLVYKAASALDRGEGSRRLAAQAKLKTGEVLQEVSQDGMQIFGGASLLPENDMERYWREGASGTIAGGSSEIQRSIISRDLLSGRNP